MRRRATDVLRAWLALALCWSLATAAIVLVQHQVLRVEANEPQVQLAEDIARGIDEGQPWTPPVPVPVPIERSLATWVVVYDAAGAPRAGSGQLHGKLPVLPGGVLEFARAHGGHRLSWQPEAGVRQALVIVPAKDGFVVAGRSLREAEERKRQVLEFMLLLWGVGLAGLLLPAMLLPSRNAS